MKSKLPALPYLVWMLIFILVPLGLVCYFAFTTGDGSFTLENIFQVGDYTSVLIKSLWLAAVSTCSAKVASGQSSFSGQYS